MSRSQSKDVVERIEQFDRNDIHNKWGSAVMPSPTLGAVIPVALVDERLAKLEGVVVALKRDCRTLNESMARQRAKTLVFSGVALLVGMALWAVGSLLFGAN